MRVSIIGAGYVGVVTGACLAEAGHRVVCIDLDEAKVARLNEGRAPIFEKDLDELLESVAGRSLFASTDLRESVLESDLTMVAVGTPSSEDGIDLRQVVAACEAIGDALRDKDSFHAVVIKSTVVPGTTEGPVREALERSSKKNAGEDFGIASNPEFLTEGTAVADFRTPDRIVLGASDPRTLEMLKSLYAGFEGVPRVCTGPSTAEMIKYASNCLLATMISFSNDFANLCRQLPKVDVADVMNGVHASHYLTSRLEDGRRVIAPIASFLEAGCGYGGSCLPKDTRAIAAQGAALGSPMRLIEAVVAVNDEQPLQMIEMTRIGLGGLQGRRITILGAAFKPDTDDVRESPSIRIAAELVHEGAEVCVCDPVALENARSVMPAGVRLESDLGASVSGAEALLLVTRWEEFQKLPSLLDSMTTPPLLVDGRRVIRPEDVERYDGIGLGRGSRATG